MKFIILAAVLFGVANAASVPSDCVVGRWSEWGECQPSRRCVPTEEQRKLTKTFSMEASDAWDWGRQVMQHMMYVKNAEREAKAACVAAGECVSPMADRPSSGTIPCVDGLAGDIPCSNVDQLSFINFADMGYQRVASDSNPAGNDVWGWTDPLNNDEYAIMGLTGATTFVRITDPANPVPVGIVYTETVASTWRDIKVIGNYAYIVSEARNHGLQVFDLTRLRGKTSVETFLPDATYKGFGNAHNIVSNEETNFVYVVGATQAGFPLSCRGGLFVIDVSNPLNPTYAGCFGGDGYVHDAQCVNYHGPDVRYQGREVCFCYNEDSFTIVDVNDKSSMTMISKTGYVNVAYTHQGWITDDHQIVLLDDELDENKKPLDEQFTKTYVWDVRDLRQPELKSVYQSSERSIDHNQYIIGDLTYQANYESGLRILHLDSETYTLSQVAYFDVFPPSTTAEFNGSWSVYPYYKSGNVVVSSIDYGLFVLRPNLAAIAKQVKSHSINAERKRTREVLHRTSLSSCPALQQSQQCDIDITC
jgi:choice-of-anchor B domain-containing protein